MCVTICYSYALIGRLRDGPFRVFVARVSERIDDGRSKADD